MMDQYWRIKKAHKDEVLFFHVGDFYEMFSDDAIEISALLDLRLTSRNGYPLCGIPYHASRTYIERLLKHGKKIAICEQISAPMKGKKLIDREVVEIITAGTIVDEDYLDKGSANYLASLAFTGNTLSFSYIDISTGDFRATSFPLEEGKEQFSQELERLQIREIIIQENILEELPFIDKALAARPELTVNPRAIWFFDKDRNRSRLEKQFGTSNLKGFGLTEEKAEILSAGSLLDYIDSTAKNIIPHVKSIIVYKDNEYVGIDESTQRNLELVRNLRDGDTKFSLLEVIDETRTSMGRRLLKHRLLHPLRNTELINKRLDIVEVLYNDQILLESFREFFVKTPDIERLTARLAMDKANARDMLSIKNAIIIFLEIENFIETIAISFEAEDASQLDSSSIDRLIELKNLLEKSINTEPSVFLNEGHLIREGYNAKLDELKKIKENSSHLLEAYLEEEKVRTGITSLKIKHNSLIGYFFEVTKTHLVKVPSYFIRRQGTKEAERFTTDKLSTLESNINTALDRAIELEKELFLELRDKAKELLSELKTAGKRIAELDVAQSLARASIIHNWTRPIVDNENRYAIIDGRHPVVESHLPRGEFIPNDIILDSNTIPFALITGPNMAGKSTYLRQAALITIMAQIGCFVPAKKGLIGITDKIYCRVGAEDNLARGESTFLVEMNETAYILNTATDKSLVIMDEVGRGTGTLDGLSIAQAVSEELLDNIKCRTLFATHFHELSMLNHPKLANRSMEVLDQGNKIVFLRKLKEGATEKSYGIHAARLAGLSERVLSRAQNIMESLEENEKKLYITASNTSNVVDKKSEDESERIMFKEFIEDIKSIDLNAITPLEALNLIHTWKEIFAGKILYRNSRKRQPDRSLF